MGPQFTANLRSFVSAVGPTIPWERFGRIPVTARTRAGWRRLRDHAAARIWKPYAFLSDAGTQGYLLERLSDDERFLYRLLCQGSVVDQARVRELLGAGSIAHYIDSGVLQHRGDGLALSVSLVPYGDSFYVCDSREALENPMPGADPVHISDQTHFQVVHLRKRLRGRPIASMLEMGTGIGIVLLEMRDLAGTRTGAEMNARALVFAQANKELHDDHGVEFVQSDLFSGVKGKYDLILFNPYQPTESQLELVRRFLAEAPQFLTPEGRVVLLIRCGAFSAERTFLAAVDDVLAEQRFSGERDVVMSWRTETPDGGRTVAAWSALWLHRNGRAAPRIRTRWNRSAVALHAKRLLA